MGLQLRQPKLKLLSLDLVYSSDDVHITGYALHFYALHYMHCC